MALQKRKEHNLETWALFIDLVKAFDTVSREALFAVLRKFGMPDHFINILLRLHTGATMKFKIGDIDTTVPSEIGVRQGSCEGPTLYQTGGAGNHDMVWQNHNSAPPRTE